MSEELYKSIIELTKDTEKQVWELQERWLKHYSEAWYNKKYVPKPKGFIWLRCPFCKKRLITMYSPKDSYHFFVSCKSDGCGYKYVTTNSHCIPTGGNWMD